MSVDFHIMVEKLKTGIWKRATTQHWKDNDHQYVTLKYAEGRIKLILHEKGGNKVAWTLNVNDSLNMRFMEME